MDAGANVGVFSILCAKLGAKRVLAFEPIEEICLKLEKNIQHNSLRNKITVVNKGLGNEQKRIKIGFDFYENEAEIVPLDMFLRGRRVDFIKIDVEGFEKEVILGAKE
ncbi:MAG: FkbM family methyltransferase, partial [Candidatus Aenigmarchaeota archaeon]|nr:FkbM family methyltransferase [Candidatus Aenigmarchaeota archaeon]